MKLPRTICNVLRWVTYMRTSWQQYIIRILTTTGLATLIPWKTLSTTPLRLDLRQTTTTINTLQQNDYFSGTNSLPVGEHSNWSHWHLLHDFKPYLSIIKGRRGYKTIISVLNKLESSLPVLHNDGRVRELLNQGAATPKSDGPMKTSGDWEVSEGSYAQEVETRNGIKHQRTSHVKGISSR